MTAPALFPALADAERAVFAAAEALQVAINGGHPTRKLLATLDEAIAVRDELKRVAS